MRPAPQLSQGELGIADRLNWDLGYNSTSRYTPSEYAGPWETEGWGSNDVVVTPPLKIEVEQKKFDDRPIIPNQPGFREGQTDYIYMPTEKEQRRERRAQAVDLARERGTRWQDRQLPTPIKKEPEIEYPSWRDTPLPTPREDEVFIQPIPREEEAVILPVPGPREPRRREWGESRPDEVYIQVEGPGNPSWESRNPERAPRQRAFDVRSTGRGISTGSTRRIPPRRQERRSRPAQVEPRREPVTSSNVMRGFGGGGLSDAIKYMVHRIDADRRY